MDLSSFITEGDTIRAVKKNKLSDKSWYTLCPKFLELDVEEIRTIMDLCPSQHHKIKIFGKEVEIPRYQDLYALDTKFRYNFSGNFIEAKDITLCPTLTKVLMEIKKFDKDYSDAYNAVFVNWYTSGKHYIGPHSDDTRDLMDGAPIYSLSYGDERVFRITRRIDNSLVEDIKLKNGMMIAMCGDFQKEFKHEVLKKNSSNKRRINLTIRAFT